MNKDCITEYDEELGNVYCSTHGQFICRGCYEHFEPIFGNEYMCKICELTKVDHQTIKSN